MAAKKTAIKKAVKSKNNATTKAKVAKKPAKRPKSVTSKKVVKAARSSVKKTVDKVKAKAQSKAKIEKKEVVKAPKKIAVSRDKQTRTQILNYLAGRCNMTKTQIENVFSELTDLIGAHMNKRGSGELTIPMTGIKVRSVKKKATKAREMVSPLTGQTVQIAAKPARSIVKLSALKVLKEMAK